MNPISRLLHPRRGSAFKINLIIEEYIYRGACVHSLKHQISEPEVNLDFQK